MDIKEHFDLIIEKYNLGDLYKKYIISSMTSAFIREGFYWSLLYLSDEIKTRPEMMKKYAIILLIIFGLNVPGERIYKKYKSELNRELRIANNDYFNNKIINMERNALLNFDLVEYNNILEHFNDNLIDYLTNQKNKYDIPIRCISLIIIAVKKDFNLLIILFGVFYIIVKNLNENKMIEERELTDKFFKYEKITRNYLINSKTFLMNNYFNEDYYNKKLETFEQINDSIMNLNDNLDMKVNLLMLLFILIVIKARINELNVQDFFYYFLIVYDIEFIADKVNEYYKNKINFNKMQERLNYLNTLKFEKHDKIIKNIDNINIKKIINSKPKLNVNNITINKGEHILINGESGSGKTTLLYILKGIVKSDEIEIEPNINIINENTFLTLSNHKGLYDGYLYDIISNYNSNPNIELIKTAIEKSKMNHKFNDNNFVIIDKLSGGERIRLLIARLIYSIKSKEYSILLFDEIDDNLNDTLALEVANNLLEIFNDKIILYITHNEKVKKIFNKVMNVSDGNINY